jgi:hypothetical protein
MVWEPYRLFLMQKMQVYISRFQSESNYNTPDAALISHINFQLNTVL